MNKKHRVVYVEPELCLRCDESILPGERSDMVQPFHHECAFRMVSGGANHLLKQCSCCGGTLFPDPEILTKRQAAKVATAIWKALQ